MNQFFTFVTEHWQFCLLHFLELGIWGAWFVVLGNLLNARGFSRKDIGRIYATVPVGTILTAFLISGLADKYFNIEWVLGISHLVGAGLLVAMAYTYTPRKFYWLTLAYAIAFAPTLNLINAIVFYHDETIFAGMANENFPWIRVFGTIGWIVAGLSHTLILKKGQPVNGNPLLLAAGLSLILGIFSFTLPASPPKGAGKGFVEAVTEISTGIIDMVAANPVFFLVTFVASMAMGLYFAFAALFLEKTGVPSRTVGPVMTIGQWIEIFFMLSLPWFLGTENANMRWVLLAGITAWAIRFGFFAFGRPLALVLAGVAIHGICFDFFFAAGMIHADQIAPGELKATAQGLYGFLVYGLGMYLGSEGAGWLNHYFSRPATPEEIEAAKKSAGASEDSEDGEVQAYDTVTNWSGFWAVPFVLVGICAVIFFFASGS